MTKKSLFSTFVLASLFLAGTVYAATYSYGDNSNGVRSTERYQAGYSGEAWTTRRGHSTGIYYYRNGAYVGGTTAYKDSWLPAHHKAYNSVWIWDSMNPWAPKTEFSIKL